MRLATLMRLAAPTLWAQRATDLESVAAAIERNVEDPRERALLAAIDWHETAWHTARVRFAPFGVMRSLRVPMTEDEVIALSLRFLHAGRRRCRSDLGMLGWYHTGRCHHGAFERRELRTWTRFRAMVAAPEPAALSPQGS